MGVREEHLYLQRSKREKVVMHLGNLSRCLPLVDYTGMGEEASRQQSAVALLKGFPLLALEFGGRKCCKLFIKEAKFLWYCSGS